MPLTHVVEPPRGNFACCDPGGRQKTTERPSRPSSDRQSADVGHRFSGAPAGRSTVCPTLHHFGLKTSNLDAMVDWYGKVLGMKPNHQTSATSTLQGAIPDGRLLGSARSSPIIAFPCWRLPRSGRRAAESTQGGASHRVREYPAAQTTCWQPTHA